MATKKQKLDALIFIDTNIFLDFYRNRKSDISLKYLELIDKHKDKIITSSQVEMEFKKNRQIVLLESIRNLKIVDGEETSIPTILSQTKAAELVVEKKKEISQQQTKLKEKIEKIFKNPVFNDPVYKSLQRLFKSKSTLNLNRTNEGRVAVRDLAKKRFMLGYPPRKDKDTSFGDAINWEWIIQCAIDNHKDIIIVSRDSDYGVTYYKEQFLNDWLLQEFKQRVSQKRKIILTDKLNVAFNLISVPVTKAMKAEEDKFIIASGMTASNTIIYSNATGGTAYNLHSRQPNEE